MNKKSIIIRNIIPYILIFSGECVFFHSVLLNDRLLAGPTDGRLNMFFMEHWYRVLRGQEFWTEQSCFYPASRVLSYSDIMLGFGLPYALLRMIGISRYMACKWILIITHAIGSFALYRFMRAYMKYARVPSFIGVIVFSWSNMYYFCTDNVQMIAFSVLPAILLCAGRWWNARDSRVRHIWAVIAICIFALQFYTAFYVGYFCLLYLGISALVLLLLSLVRDLRRRSAGIWQCLKKHFGEFLLYAVCFVFLMIPFIWLYLPTLDQMGGRTWAEVDMFIPRVRNLIMRNTDAYSFFAAKESIADTNALTGLPVTEWITFCISCLGLLIYYLRKRKTDTLRQLFWITAILSCLCSVLLGMSIMGHSLWYIVYKLLPGASGIRAVLRWYLILTLPMALIMAEAFQKIYLVKKTAGYIMGAAAAGLLFCTNCSRIGASSSWSVHSEEAFLESVPQPPADCRIFYSVQTEEADPYVEGLVQMDAWDMADHFGIITIDGYSGKEPEGWGVHSYYKDVDQKAEEWLAKNAVDKSGLYAYDVSSHQWIKKSD